MIEVFVRNDPHIIELAMTNICNTVYPLSVAENYQKGQIFVDSANHPKAALFWRFNILSLNIKNQSGLAMFKTPPPAALLKKQDSASSQ